MTKNGGGGAQVRKPSPGDTTFTYAQNLVQNLSINIYKVFRTQISE